MIERIIESNGKKYLSDIMKDLPENVMLNKVTTGCGMTSVVLSNDVKYVLAVPFVSLIKNKEIWCKEKGIEVCPVYYGAAIEEDIISFKGNKIITTYDSLNKVTEALEKRGDIKEWKICIDEAHKLVDSAAFRGKAVGNVLSNYKKYKSYFFGTATPVPDKYQLPALKHIPKARVQWDDLESVNVNYCQYDGKIYNVAAIISIDFLKGIRDGNAHIFINSVSGICSVINKLRKAGIDMPNDIRIVCADNPRNQKLIESKLPSNYYISPVDSDVKKLNFYTATAFEGCDIYDKEGKTIIITDGSRDYTKIDIATVLPQIIGRVRDSKYKNMVDLIYSKNSYITKLTEAEYEQLVQFELKEALKDIEEFEQLRENSIHRKNALKNNTSPYLIVEQDRLVLNENAWYNEMYKYKTMNSTYYVSKKGTNATICNGTKNFNGVNYKYTGIEKVEIKGLNKVKLGQKAAFKDLCEDFIRVMNEEDSFLKSAKIASVKEKESMIFKAYNKLGVDKMKALGLRRKNIEEALLSISNDINCDVKIVKLLGLRMGQWISKKDAKAKLQDIYKRLNLKRKAKATDLNNWYKIRPKNSRCSGKLESGFEIGTPKISTK